MYPSSKHLRPAACSAILILTILAAGMLANPPEALSARPGRLPAPPDQDRRPLATLASGFPRLGMWWPDTWNQPLQDIARYDWVIFGDWEKDRVAAIKTINPDLLALNSTNACELGFNPDPNAEPWENAAVRDIPAAWFLTQVGTQLSQPVNAAQTILPVQALTAGSGAGQVNLFVAGDTAVLDSESVYIESVNTAAGTLTVRRGYVRPAAAHPAGTRIAAHITFWPHSWVLNLSTLSPTAVISPTIGPERWSGYNARQAAALLADPIWDGILLDRSDPDESWLIGNSTARSIDPDQSNTLITDYSAFDAAWNQGIRDYESSLRSLVGPGEIIFSNWGMANYDLLNGNNFEGFPDDAGTAYGTPWSTAVFGPWERGSYFEWVGQAQQPNLTMIETYEDDSGPDPGSDGAYDNPCDDPGFTPNYRKMRYGLATALLNDGFFSYEINTNGHGSLCLMWFDEYDNAGQGRGYLGQPLGPASRAIAALAGPNLVTGGGFETFVDLQAWQLWADETNGYAAVLSRDTGAAAVGSASARIEVQQAAGTDWQISLINEPLPVTAGQEYTLSFWAKAGQARAISAWVQRTSDPWDGWLDFGSFQLDNIWQYYEIAVPAAGSDPAAGLYFGLGEAQGTVWLDDIRLQSGSREVWRRDFAHGLALVNTTASAQVIDLGGVFRRITGSQDPLVNNGSLVSHVTLPPHDGLVLLRIQQRLFLPLLSP